MAITIVSQPISITTIKNPVEFQLTSTNQTECGFRFVASLYVQKTPWLNNTFTKVIEVRKYPLQSTNNRGVFDFSNILEDFITVGYDLMPTSQSPRVSISKSYLKYYVVFTEEYEALCDGNPSQYSPTTTAEYVVFNGRADFDRYKYFRNITYYAFKNNYLSRAPQWINYTNDAINLPQYDGYIHDIHPNDNYPVTLSYTALPYPITNGTYMVFELNQTNGLKKFKMPDLTPYLSTKLANNNQFFTTDFGTRQRDNLLNGNKYGNIVDSYTVDYEAYLVQYLSSSNQKIVNSGTLNYPITDSTTTIAELNVTESVLPTVINVRVNLTHSWLGDLSINLVSPSGKIINLFSNQLGSDDNMTNTVFSTNLSLPSITTGSSPYTGTFRMSAAIGSGTSPYVSNVGNMVNLLNDYSSYGTWKLVIRDNGAGDTGNLVDWGITFVHKELIEVSPRMKFKLRACGVKNNLRFYWLNKLGGWDSYSFTKSKSKKLDIQRDNFERYVDYNNYELFGSGMTQYNTQTTEIGSVHSDWMDIKTSDWLAELLTSPYVYVQDNSPYLDVIQETSDSVPPAWEDLPYPEEGSFEQSIRRVVITDTSYSYYTKDNVKLTNLNITFQESNQNDVIRF